MTDLELSDVVIVTVLPEFELPAALRAFGVDPSKIAPKPIDMNLRYWSTEILSSSAKRTLSVAVVAIEKAGNPEASAVTTSLIYRFRPTMALLVGIAAGVESKVRLGDVIISECVLGYEQARLTPDGDVPRPQFKTPYGSLLGDLRHFNHRAQSEGFTEIFGRLQRSLTTSELPPPDIIVSPRPKLGWIASGEKLLADGSLPTLSKRWGDAVLAGEMEGIGFATAAERAGVPWLVIRGVSDFGDPRTREDRLKDRFHHTASNAAASYAVTFLKHGYTASKQVNLTGPVREAGIDNLFDELAPLPIRAALVTGADNKAYLDNLIDFLTSNGVSLIATPRTAQILRTRGTTVQTTWEYTRSEPIGDIRGTLHPYVLASIASDPNDPKAHAELEKKGLRPINLVIVNATITQMPPQMTATSLMDTISGMQAGVPFILRWALRKWRTASAVVEPLDFDEIIRDLASHRMQLGGRMRLKLFRRASEYLAQRDSATCELLKRVWNQ